VAFDSRIGIAQAANLQLCLITINPAQSVSTVPFTTINPVNA